MNDSARSESRESAPAPSIALLESEELNRRMIEAMPGGIVHVGADGSILASNAHALAILGLSFDALTKRYTRDFEPETVWDDGSPCLAADYPVTRALVTGEAQPPATIGITRPDGTVSWAVFTAVPVLAPNTRTVIGAVVTFLDITARKQAEAALRQSEGLLRSLFESSPNLIATADRDGNIILLSKAPPGRAAREFTERPAWADLRPEFHAVARAAIHDVVTTGEARSFDSTALSGRRWRSHVGARRDGGEIVGVTIVAWDITEQRELEARLAIADRMASIGTLAAGVAHEINNPLTFVLANLEMLARKSAIVADEDARAKLAAALEGAGRIRSVVADLGSFSHVGEGRAVRLDVHPMLDSAVRMATNEIRCRARIVRHYDATSPVLATDGRLGQVFLNLVVNAAQAIPEGDADHHEITIRTRMDAAGRVVVEVADTGVGIAPELIETIFDPFVTTKPRGVGTGLGLFICKNVVKSLGGELDVTSTPGVGATFRVSLPAASRDSQPIAAPMRAPSEAPAVASAERRKILIVDDEPLLVKILAEFLDGHDVSIACSGREAIERLTERDFDLVFCDLVMPNLTGMDVHEHVRAHSPAHAERIVFMTGGAFTERARAFLETAANRVLDKPFSFDQVAAIVEGSRASAG